MLEKNVETFIACGSEYEEAKIVLFGAPFDSTTSYRPGARFAGRAIRGESYGIETYSPYQDADLEDCRVFDSGELELCIGSSEAALLGISERTAAILDDGKLPIMLGGEHLVTLGAVREVIKRHPGLKIIHFDAHADLREDYLGARLSHACVIRRCHELLGDGSIFQFGIRSGDKSEFLWAKKGHTEMRRFDFEGLCGALESIKGSPVYLTGDLDVLDPSVFPGTGTPEAGGVSFTELLNAILLVARGSRLVGCDICELSPIYDQSGVSTAVACKLLRELIIAVSAGL